MGAWSPLFGVETALRRGTRVPTTPLGTLWHSRREWQVKPSIFFLVPCQSHLWLIGFVYVRLIGFADNCDPALICEILYDSVENYIHLIFSEFLRFRIFWSFQIESFRVIQIWRFLNVSDLTLSKFFRFEWYWIFQCEFSGFSRFEFFWIFPISIFLNFSD